MHKTKRIFAESYPILTEKDWEKLEICIEISPAIYSTPLHVYVMNEDAEKVFFDDLPIASILDCLTCKIGTNTVIELKKQDLKKSKSRFLF